MGNKDKDGKKFGFGIQKWRDGSKFKGNFIKDCATGWGIFYHADGDIYKGQFANDITNGYGEYFHENRRYEEMIRKQPSKRALFLRPYLRLSTNLSHRILFSS